MSTKPCALSTQLGWHYYRVNPYSGLSGMIREWTGVGEGLPLPAQSSPELLGLSTYVTIINEPLLWGLLSLLTMYYAPTLFRSVKFASYKTWILFLLSILGLLEIVTKYRQQNESNQSAAYNVNITVQTKKNNFVMSKNTKILLLAYAR